MAKKQTIILTHGSSIPSNGIISGMSLGEVLVQHGTGATDTMLHTVYQTGDTNEKVLVSFPSKEWVNEQINSLEAGEMAEAIERIEKGYKEAISALTETFEENKLETSSALTENHSDIVAVSGTVESVIEDVSTISGTVVSHTETLEQLSTNKLDINTFNEEKSLIEGTLTGITNVLSGYTTQGEVKSEIDQLKSSKLDATAFTEFNKTYEQHVTDTTAKFNSIDQLLSGTGTTEAIDTLRDVLDWLQGTTEEVSGATKVIKDVNDLKDNLSDLPSGKTVVEYVTGITNQLDGRIEGIEDGYINEVTFNEGSGVVCDERVEGSHQITINFEHMIIDGGEY